MVVVNIHIVVFKQVQILPMTLIVNYCSDLMIWSIKQNAASLPTVPNQTLLIYCDIKQRKEENLHF